MSVSTIRAGLVPVLFLLSLKALAGLNHAHGEAAVSSLSHAQWHAWQSARQALQAQPFDQAAAINLARIKLNLAQDLRDESVSADVPEILQPWWKQQPVATEVLVIQGQYYQQRHEFSAARRALSQVLQRQPDHASALLLLSSVEHAQGFWRAGRQACAGLILRQPDWLVAACLSQSAASRSALQQSLSLIRRRPNDGSRLDQWAADIEREVQRRLELKDFQLRAPHPLNRWRAGPASQRSP